MRELALNLENVLIQIWETSMLYYDKGKLYTDLTTRNKPSWITSDDAGGLSLYRKHSALSNISVESIDIKEDEEDEEDEDEDIEVEQEGGGGGTHSFPLASNSEGVIGRVFRNDRSEMSPSISYYSIHEYPLKDFASKCGIRTSFCFPLFKNLNAYSLSCCVGVLEFASTCDHDLGKVRQFCDYFVQSQSSYLLDFPRINRQEHAVPEIDLFLTTVCHTLPIRLAQYWVIADPKFDTLQVMYQKSNINFENLTPWCKFKDACLHMGSSVGQDLVGITYRTYKSYFCRDVNEFSIANYSLAHYARNCGPNACLTILLHRSFPKHTDSVLEFFLPSEEIDSDYSQTLLNSIYSKMKEQLTEYEFTPREELGQLAPFEVITCSNHNDPNSFKLVLPKSSFAHPELPGNEEETSQEVTGISQVLFRDEIEQKEHALGIIKCNATGETSKVDELEEESVKFIKLQSLTSKRNRAEEILEDEEHSVGMDHPGLEMTFAHEKYTVTAARDESVVGSVVENVGYATSNADFACATSDVEVGYAMSTASQLSGLQTMKMLCQQVEEEAMVSEKKEEASEQLTKILQPFVEDGSKRNQQVLHMTKSTPSIILYEENATGETSKRPSNSDAEIIYMHEQEGGSLIRLIEPHSVISQLRRSKEIFESEGNNLASENDELVEVSSDEDFKYSMTTASKRLKKYKVPFTLENIRKHFGRPQKDAADSFGVSLSTFKRNCRLVGIKRWQPGKRKLIDDKTCQKEISSGMPHVQDIPAVAHTHTGQELNKMDVKVMYNGVPIRFELPTSSGISDLENSVIERLPLDRKSFSIKYQDDEGDWVLIACDKDVQKCLEISRSLKKTTIKMLLDPPIKYCPP